MYNFIDVIEETEGVSLPSEALQINGAFIEDQIAGYRTLTVEGREALSPEVSTFETGIRDGSTMKGKRYPARIIRITYQLIAASNEAFREAFNKLAAILDVKDAELIFNDEQDKFFTGTPCAIGEVPPGRNAVVGEFEIMCADPFKYSVIEYEAEADLDAQSILIDYGGTCISYPTLHAEFFNENDASEDGGSVKQLTGNGDCGYVAFFTEDEKIIQLGDPDEVDGENSYAKSQTLVNSTFKTAGAWGNAAMSQWPRNSGVDSSVFGTVEQTGAVTMGVASNAVHTEPKTTSAMILKVRSEAEKPYVDYQVTVKTTGRTLSTVDVEVSIKASLASTKSYFLSGFGLEASIYVDGAWHSVTLKKTAEEWRGTTGHVKILSFTVSGLVSAWKELKDIRFKAVRTDNNGSTGILPETACSNIPISAYIPDVPATYFLCANNYNSGDKWHGVSITRTLPADAAGEVGAVNCALTYSQKMCMGSGNKGLGAFHALLVSGSGANRSIVAGVAIQKSIVSTKNAKLRFCVGGRVVETIDVDLSYNNKYFTSAKSSTITKTGQTVTFDICGIKRTYKDASIAETAVHEVTFMFLQWRSFATLAYNGLYWAKVVKNNCNTWREIPNKFSANDVLEADCKNGEIYLNGAFTPALGALGNDWETFCLKPGLNQIGYSYSDWVAAGYAPKCTVKYREVFL